MVLSLGFRSLEFMSSNQELHGMIFVLAAVRKIYIHDRNLDMGSETARARCSL